VAIFAFMFVFICDCGNIFVFDNSAKEIKSVRNTEQKIINAFLNLAANETTQTAEYGTITLQMILDKASITKPTFYHHFKNIRALMDVIKEREYGMMFHILDSHSPKDTVSPFGVIANEIIPFFYKNQTILRIMRNSSVDFNHQQYLENAFTSFFIRFLNPKENRYHLNSNWLASYYSKVIVGMLTTWLADSFPEAPENFKEKFLFLINTPLNSFC